MPPVEAWEKVWIDSELYTADVHAFINCTACHGGESVDDMDTAHVGLVSDPSADPESGCADCHPNVSPHAAESLHYTLAGYDTALYARSSPEHYDALEEMQSYHCNSCHATCGDCHVSQPNSVGGGLLEGHAFVETPPMSRTCTGCHGSRVKNEYYGLNEGVPGDVHLRQARLACTDCHGSDEMHGEGEAGDAAHRYDGSRQPECESCHAGDVGVGSGITQHEIHGTEIIPCQACHSVAYTNCTNCHVDRTEEDVPYYTVEDHSLGFFLGVNTLRSAERPYRYVPVRHVPVDVNSFDTYGENLLDNFLSRPTWTYATPHNIQLTTPQTETCESCHGNDAVFLTPDKVAPDELAGANLDVVVESAPPVPEGYEEYLEPQEEAAQASSEEGTQEAEINDDVSFWGIESSLPSSEDDSDTPAEADDSAVPADTGESDEDASFWGDDSDTPAEADDSAASSDTDESDSSANTLPEVEDSGNSTTFWGSVPAEAVVTGPSDNYGTFWGN